MNRLRAFRELEGINQSELGDLLGISATMVSAIEGGRRPFTGDLTPLGYGPERLSVPDMSEPLHRQRASTKASTRRRAHEILRLAGEVFAELRATTPNVPPVQIERLSPPASDADVDDLATELRYMLSISPDGPIRNLTAAVERAGVCIVPIPGQEGVDGLSAWVEGVPVIGLSPNVPGDRFRFTLGHELAHLVFHSKPGRTAEMEANRFSSALLFPTPEFEASMPDYPQLRDFVALKSSWGVAVSALVYRAHEHDFIDDKRYRSLQIQMSKWRKTEPAYFDPMYGELMPRLIAANGGVQASSKELVMNASHIGALTQWRHLRAA